MGTIPFSTSRLLGTPHACGMVVLAFELLASTGCATVRDYLIPRSETQAKTTAPRETDSEAFSPTNERCDASPLLHAKLAHVVRSGETLSEIALDYRVLISELYALNSILDPDRIEVGQRLSLPSHAIISPRPPPARMSRPESSRSEALMSEAEKHYQAARFERALALAQEARSLMEAESDRSKQLARAAFLAGSALVGLGEEQRASAEFDRVHALDSHFEPPDGWLSPRLNALYGDTLAK